MAAEEQKYREERISTTTSSTQVTDPIQQLCLDSNIPAHAAVYPEPGEYHILVKQGKLLLFIILLLFEIV